MSEVGGWGGEEKKQIDEEKRWTGLRRRQRRVK